MIVDAESMLEWFINDLNKTAELEGQSPEEISQETIYLMAKEKTKSLIKNLGGGYEE